MRRVRPGDKRAHGHIGSYANRRSGGPPRRVVTTPGGSTLRGRLLGVGCEDGAVTKEAMRDMPDLCRKPHNRRRGHSRIRRRRGGPG